MTPTGRDACGLYERFTSEASFLCALKKVTDFCPELVWIFGYGDVNLPIWADELATERLNHPVQGKVCLQHCLVRSFVHEHRDVAAW